ncbi:MAG TPA: hypothetical protein VM689_06505 [Aliidongia sp.]|nr:hypothetical protein [Aliidongia sp.]
MIDFFGAALQYNSSIDSMPFNYGLCVPPAWFAWHVRPAQIEPAGVDRYDFQSHKGCGRAGRMFGRIECLGAQRHLSQIGKSLLDLAAARIEP